MMLVSLLFVLTALAGCSGQGEFGREQPSILAQRVGMNPYTHVSGYQTGHWGRTALTPAETEMRMFANALAKGYAHQKTHGGYADFAPIVPRKLMARLKSRSSAKFYVGLINHHNFKSNEARLNAIVDDMRTDSRNIDGMWAAARVVYDADSKRVREIEGGNYRPPVAQEIIRRIDENRTIVNLVLQALGERLAGYNMAVSEAYLADPSQGQAGAKLEVTALERKIGVFDANINGLGVRHALALPRSDGCILRSLARTC